MPTGWTEEPAHLLPRHVPLQRTQYRGGGMEPLPAADADVAMMAKYNNGEITKEECDQNLSHKY